jgi:hypothetical protein
MLRQGECCCPVTLTLQGHLRRESFGFGLRLELALDALARDRGWNLSSVAKRPTRIGNDPDTKTSATDKDWCSLRLDRADLATGQKHPSSNAVS